MRRLREFNPIQATLIGTVFELLSTFFSWGYHVFILEDTAEMALNTGTSDFLSSFRRLLSNQDQANSCQKFHAYRFAIDT